MLGIMLLCFSVVGRGEIVLLGACNGKVSTSTLGYSIYMPHKHRRVV